MSDNWITVERPIVTDGSVVRYPISWSASLHRSFSGELMFVSYSLNLHGVPESILLIPKRVPKMDALWIVVGLGLVVWAFYSLPDPPQRHKDVSFIDQKEAAHRALGGSHRPMPLMLDVQQYIRRSGNFLKSSAYAVLTNRPKLYAD